MCKVFKTSHAHDAQKATTKPQLLREQTFNIMPADDADTMFLSMPHRLLAIALRRGLLKRYKTVDELFEGNTRQIAIKDEHLDSPILLGAKAQGEGVTGEPLSAQAITVYLKDRGLKVGFPEFINYMK